MGAFSNMDYELQNSGAAVSDAFTEDDAMDMPQTAPVEPATASSPTAAPTPAAAASEPATAPNTQSEDEARRAHEASEAKRKAEWEEKQRKRKEAEQAAWENAVAMDDDQLLKASVKRLGDDAERVTRRNMKQCVTEYIQTHCYEDMDFARQVMHPRKTMIRCFRYINRKARDFMKQEMEDNDEKPTAEGYSCDIPDDLCYQ